MVRKRRYVRRKYKLKAGTTYKYYGAGLFYRVIRAYNLKFPFTQARKIIKWLIDNGYIEKYKGRFGTTRYRVLRDFSLPLAIPIVPVPTPVVPVPEVPPVEEVPKVPEEKWKEYNYTYTFVATRPVRVETIKLGNREIKRKIDRKIELNFTAIASAEPEEDIKSKIIDTVEKIIRDNEYGFIFDEPNTGAGSSFKITEVDKKPDKFIGVFRVYDHTYNRTKADGTFELPEDWWELSVEELAEWIMRYVKFVLLARGRKKITQYM